MLVDLASREAQVGALRSSNKKCHPEELDVAAAYLGTYVQQRPVSGYSSTQCEGKQRRKEVSKLTGL